MCFRKLNCKKLDKKENYEEVCSQCYCRFDIDWEYPQNKKDWACYDVFMKELDEKMAQVKPDAIISAALSAWAFGMKPETMEIIDQIQYMAYDDIDIDGVQSTMLN